MAFVETLIERLPSIFCSPTYQRPVCYGAIPVHAHTPYELWILHIKCLS